MHVFYSACHLCGKGYIIKAGQNGWVHFVSLTPEVSVRLPINGLSLFGDIEKQIACDKIVDCYHQCRILWTLSLTLTSCCFF